VIEDSINGVKSAKSAGILCIAVPDKRLNRKEFKIADLVVGSIDKISVQFIKNLDRLGLNKSFGIFELNFLFGNFVGQMKEIV